MFIDTPPSLGLLTINAFVAANGVIVPVQCEYLSMRGLVQLQNTLEMIDAGLRTTKKELDKKIFDRYWKIGIEDQILRKVGQLTVENELLKKTDALIRQRGRRSTS